MTIIFEDESGIELPFDGKEQAARVIEGVLDYEKCPYEAEVNLVLTTDDGIQEVNKEMRQTDSPTDVLSFPMLEYEMPGDFSFLEEDELSFHPESGELILGDILLNVERVYLQAQEYGHSVLREFSFLVAHSMLHLCGYDHMEPEEAEIMEERQRDILDGLGITRD